MPTLANNKADFSSNEKSVRQPVAATCAPRSSSIESETEPGLVAIMRRLQYAPRYVPLRAIVLHSRK